MKQKELLSVWAESGTAQKDLEDVLANIDISTEIIEIRPGKDLTLYASDPQSKIGECIVADLTDPLNGGGLSTYMAEEIKTSVMKAWEHENKDEAFKNKIFVSWIDKKGDEVFAYADPTCLTNLHFAGIGGEAMSLVTWPIINAASFLLNTKGCKLVVRKATDKDGKVIVRKVITIRSLQYMDCRQLPLLQMTNEICKDGMLRSWSVCNDFTVVTYDFPNLGVTRTQKGMVGTCTPRIRFCTSDAGKSGLNWKLGWEIDDGTKKTEVYLSPGRLEFQANHKGVWNEKKKNNVTKNVAKLFDKSNDLIEKIDELRKTEIYFGEIEVVLKNLMADNKEFSKLVKKEVRDALIEEASKKFTDPVHTADELVMFLQDVPDRLTGLLSSTIYSIKQACGEFFYQKIRKDVTIKEKKKED